MTTCGVPTTRSLLRLDPTPAVHLTVRLFWRAGGFPSAPKLPALVGAVGGPGRRMGARLASITVEAHAMIN
jgi:hypothetical protein